MPLIDDQGRLFGRINLFDAFVGLVVLALIPLGYLAFVLFRVPMPTITSVEPAQIVEHQQGTMTIHGEHLRPFLHARIGNRDAPTYMVQTPKRAVIQLPDLTAGTYAVSLHDEGDQLLSVPGLVTVTVPEQVTGTAAAPAPPPTAIVQVAGHFEAVPEETARTVRPGTAFYMPGEVPGAPSIGEVLAARTRMPGLQRIPTGDTTFAQARVPGTVRIPATLRLRCVVSTDGCRLGGILLRNGGTIALSPRASAGAAAPLLRFHVDVVRSADAPVDNAVATLRVRFTMPLNFADALDTRRNDVESAAPSSDATLIGSGYDRQSLPWKISDDAPGRSAILRQPLVAVTWEVRAPVAPAAGGWAYRDQPLRVGAPLRIDTAYGPMGGIVVEMNVSGDNPVEIR